MDSRFTDRHQLVSAKRVADTLQVPAESPICFEDLAFDLGTIGYTDYLDRARVEDLMKDMEPFIPQPDSLVAKINFPVTRMKVEMAYNLGKRLIDGKNFASALGASDFLFSIGLPSATSKSFEISKIAVDSLVDWVDPY